ncbi:hypothetical protein GJ496_009581 [Pomphorhynchus laevis]|nr:hypothetical protein GJ496_009581 [Pomphorhynchus laevis]
MKPSINKVQQLWSYSTPLDVLKIAESLVFKTSANCGDNSQVNLLFCGVSSIPHILNVIFNSTASSTKFNILVYCANDFQTIRLLILYYILLEDTLISSISETRECFSDIFANIKVTEKSYTILRRACVGLVNILQEQLNSRASTSWINLQFFRIDQITQLIHKLNTIGLLEHQRRLDSMDIWEDYSRRYTGSRYDIRNRIFEYEYSFRIDKYAQDVVDRNTYSKWRSTGVAYDVGTPRYSNSTILHNQDCSTDAFICDILHGPFLSLNFGEHCRHSSNNDQYSASGLTKSLANLLLNRKFILADDQIEISIKDILDEIESEEDCRRKEQQWKSLLLKYAESEKDYDELNKVFSLNDYEQNIKNETSGQRNYNFTISVLPSNSNILDLLISQDLNCAFLDYSSRKLLRTLCKLNKGPNVIFCELAKIVSSLYDNCDELCEDIAETIDPEEFKISTINDGCYLQLIYSWCCLQPCRNDNHQSLGQNQMRAVILWATGIKSVLADQSCDVQIDAPTTYSALGTCVLAARCSDCAIADCSY